MFLEIGMNKPLPTQTSNPNQQDLYGQIQVQKPTQTVKTDQEPDYI